MGRRWHCECAWAQGLRVAIDKVTRAKRGLHYKCNLTLAVDFNFVSRAFEFYLAITECWYVTNELKKQFHYSCKKPTRKIISNSLIFMSYFYIFLIFSICNKFHSTDLEKDNYILLAIVCFYFSCWEEARLVQRNWSELVAADRNNVYTTGGSDGRVRARGTAEEQRGFAPAELAVSLAGSPRTGPKLSQGNCTTCSPTESVLPEIFISLARAAFVRVEFSLFKSNAYRIWLVRQFAAMRNEVVRWKADRSEFWVCLLSAGTWR